MGSMLFIEVIDESLVVSLDLGLSFPRPSARKPQSSIRLPTIKRRSDAGTVKTTESNESSLFSLSLFFSFDSDVSNVPTAATATSVAATATTVAATLALLLPMALLVPAFSSADPAAAAAEAAVPAPTALAVPFYSPPLYVALNMHAETWLNPLGSAQAMPTRPQPPRCRTNTNMATYVHKLFVYEQFVRLTRTSALYLTSVASLR